MVEAGDLQARLCEPPGDLLATDPETDNDDIHMFANLFSHASHLATSGHVTP